MSKQRRIDFNSLDFNSFAGRSGLLLAFGPLYMDENEGSSHRRVSPALEANQKEYAACQLSAIMC
jgi:hypothetical protein